MPTVNLAAPQVAVTLQHGDPATINVLSDDAVPSTLELWVGTRAAPGTALAELTGSSITGGRSYVLSEEDSLALRPSRAYQLVARDSATGVTWFTGAVSPSTEGAAGPTSQTVTVALSEVSVTVDITVAAGAGSEGSGTTMPSGTAGQVPQVLSGSTYELKTPNTPDGVVRLNGSGTIPDILGPSSWARDTEVDAAVAEVTPLDVDVAISCAAVDGTATSFKIVRPAPGADASGIIPAGWEQVFDADVATLQYFFSVVVGTTTPRMLRVHASSSGVFTVPLDDIDSVAWTAITPTDGVTVRLGWNYGGVETWLDSGAARYVSALLIPKIGEGLDAGLTNVNGVLENHEGILDTERWVGAWYETNVTVASYLATPTVLGSQPAPTGGVVVLGCDVLLIGQSDTTENGYYSVDASTGAWTRMGYPDILIGNSHTCTVNADGSADDGTHFEWVDDDVTIKKRRSFEAPGSSDGESDGSGGRWIKYSPTLEVGTTAGTVAAGNDVRFSPVVGGQDEGPVVTATSATTMLDSTITLTGTAGDLFTVTIGGRFNNQSGTTKSPTITVKLASTTVCTLTPAGALSSNAADRLFRATIDIRVNAATDINVVGDGQITTSVFGVSTGSASDDISAGLALDVQGAVQSGGSQEIQLTQVSVVRYRA